MKNLYLLKFYYDREHSITLPVKASNPERLSNIITDAYINKKTWISFPVKDKQNRILGRERITVNLDEVKYFKIEAPTRVYLESFSEEEYIDLELEE